MVSEQTTLLIHPLKETLWCVDMWHRFFRLFCSVFPPCAAFVDLPCLIAAWQGPSFCPIGYDPSRCLLWKWLNRDRNCSTYQLIWLGNCVSNYRKLYHNFLGCGMLLKHGFIIPKLQLGPVPPVAFHKTACVNLNCLSLFAFLNCTSPWVATTSGGCFISASCTDHKSGVPCSLKFKARLCFEWFLQWLEA